MEIKIQKEKETPLLSRKRISVMANYSGATPSRSELRKAIASKIKAKEELLVIRHIYTRFGQQKAKVIVHLYSDPITMVRLEGQELVDKHESGQEKKAEEKGDAKKEGTEKKDESKGDGKEEESPAEKEQEKAEKADEKETAPEKNPEDKKE